MSQASSNCCVDLNVAARVLAKSEDVQGVVKRSVGERDFPRALKMMRAGILTGELGAKLHDLLDDAISNDATTIWSGIIRAPHDDYPVNVNAYHGVFWAWAMEYDPVGYFLNEDDAIAYARSAWGDVIADGEADEDDEDDVGDVRCPFCDTTDACDHLLLMVDTTFRQAEGGALYSAFNERWADIVNDADDPDFDEQEPFDELLDEVSALADAEVGSSSDNAPGMSANYILYYCRSKQRTAAALKKFQVT